LNDFLKSPDRPDTAIVLVGSNITAIAAELAVRTGGYPRALAIVRRGSTTSLPAAPHGSQWVDRMKSLGLLRARREIRDFLDYITDLAGGKPFDCFIHHSSNAFSQLLTSHPLCRRYFYIEEGITAILGRQFGRPAARPFKRLLSSFRNTLFFGGQVDKYGPFFNTAHPKYGGACAFSSCAFRSMPHRIALPAHELGSTVPVSAAVVVFLDSQYIIGNCPAEDYIRAMAESLRTLISSTGRVAVKFHPLERDEARRQRILETIRSLPHVEEVTVLPPDFIGERMEQRPGTKVLVGTSSLGFYTGERGFETYTFAMRLAAASPKFSAIMSQFPKEFQEVCKPA
jgi:hypothetical protein